MILPWFKKYEDRYNLELKKFADAELEFTIDEASRDKGILILNFKIPKNNKLGIELENDEEFRVEFPESYPYFRPEVFGLTIDLPRHQNPLAKNLCLLPRPSQFWDVSKTLIEHLQEQMPKLLVKGKVVDQDLIAEDEDEQAEPISEYHSVPYNFVIAADFFKDESEIPDSTPPNTLLEHGKFLFKLLDANAHFVFGLPTDNSNFMRVLIQEWMNERDVTLTSKPFDNGVGPTYTGHWFRFNSFSGDVNAIASQLLEKVKAYKKNEIIKIKDGSINNIVGITFPEESTKGVLGWGWLFIVYTVRYVTTLVNGRQQRVPKANNIIIGSTRIGESDYSARIPDLLAFRTSKLSIVGLGSLGAPSAIEFAKNGIGSLNLLDCDRAEPSSSVRWPLGLAYAGLYKTEALKTFIKQNYPHTIVNTFNHKIGAARSMNHSADSEVTIIANFLQDSSLVFDASAEEGINNLLSQEAKLKLIPYISIEARRGAWGGVVLRVMPNEKKACWMCIQYAFASGEIKAPPQDEGAGIQPRGCGDITFTGASFDLQNISLAGVRLAASTLCFSERQNKMDWNVAVLELVDEKSNPIVPRWTTYLLETHPKCPYCAVK